MKNIHIQYFAVLREERGLNEEWVQTEAQNLGELYDELRTTHGFFLKRRKLKVALDDAFVGWERETAEGQRVVFIPPVGGG